MLILFTNCYVKTDIGIFYFLIFLLATIILHVLYNTIISKIHFPLDKWDSHVITRIFGFSNYDSIIAEHCFRCPDHVIF